MTDEKKMKIVFAPGCFDDFEGTQEELDEMVAELTRLAESGELMEQTIPVSIDDLDEETLTTLMDQLEMLDDSEDEDGDEGTEEYVPDTPPTRVLH